MQNELDRDRIVALIEIHLPYSVDALDLHPKHFPV
jgi:hypothetical protein